MKGLLAAALLATLPAGAARATVYTVTDDSDPGSLRTAVGNSNSAGGTNTISWASTNGGTISLGSELDVNGTTTLDVSNANSAVTIAGSDISIGGSETFSNNSSTQTFSLSSAINGAGTLSNAGAGTVALTGANGYSGGTTINSGILAINGDAALGNTAGGINFNGGTLQTVAAVNSARNITLTGNGTFDTDGNSSTFSGVVSGAGELFKVGAGILYLSGANTYTGGTEIEAGVLSIGADASLGTGGITFNGGTLQTNAGLTDARTITLTSTGTIDTNGNASAFTGLISGAGLLVQVGSGTLVLSGANTYTGGTAVTGGTLVVTADSNMGGPSGLLTLNGGTLQTQAGISSIRPIFIGASSGTIDNFGNVDSFSGAITGSGSLTLVGTGVVNLEGTGNSWAGGTTVTAGTLQYGAKDALPANGALTVSAGAAVDLNGFSQDSLNPVGAVLNSGLIDVGAGTLTMNAYSGTGILEVSMSTSVTNIASSGGQTINLNGTTLEVGLASPLVSSGTVFTPITGSTGTLAAIVSPAALLFVPSYSVNGVTLTTHFVPLASIAATNNQAAVGAGIEPLRANPTGDVATVLGSVYTLNAAQLQSALDQMGPIALASMGTLGFATSGIQSAALDRRMAGIADGSGGGLTTFSLSARPSPAGNLLAENGMADDSYFRESTSPWSGSGLGVFASLVGSLGKLDSINGASGTQPGYTFYTGGLMTGMDRRIGEHLALGLAGGYMYGNSSLDTLTSGTIVNNSLRYGAYMTAFNDAFRLNLYAGGAHDFFSTSRDILFGSVSRTAKGTPAGNEVNLSAKADYDLKPANWGMVSPFAGLNYDRLMINSFSESGAGALDLDVGQQTAESLRSNVGLRGSVKFSDQGFVCLGYLSAAWQHEFRDQSRPIDAQFANGAGSVFSVATADYPRDGALLGTGFSIKLTDALVVNLDYTYDVRPGFYDNQVSAALRGRF